MTDAPQRLSAIPGVIILLLALGHTGVLRGADTRPSAEAPPSSANRLLARGQFGETRLHWMVFHGDEGAVRELLDAGADINARVKKGATPLHLAAYKGHGDILRLLLARGARVNVQTDAGVTPLDWAVRNGHHEVAGLLLAHGATHGPHWQDTLRPARTNPGSRPPAATPLALELPPQLRAQPPESAADRPSSGAARATTGAAARTGRFGIQLAAVSSERRARVAWQHYRERHPEILDGLPLTLDSVVRDGRTLYRVRAGRLQRTQAHALCDRLVQRGQPCHPVALGVDDPTRR